MPSTTRREFLKTSAALGAGVAPLAAAGIAQSQTTAILSASARQPKRINHDLHTHTTYSDGAHPVPLHILEARAFELDVIAITDHYVPGYKICDSEAEFERYLDEIQRERSAQDDVVVLKGAEATALDPTGRITLDPEHAARLEWILCDLGGKSEGTLRNTPSDKQHYIENVIRTYMGMCDVPFLHVIAHPFNTGNTQPAALPEDYPERLLRELAQKMADKQKVFDVMNDMIYWFHRSGVAPRTLTAQYVELVKVFVSEGVRFQLSSDDHRTGLGNTRWSEIVVARAEVPDAQIVDPKQIPRVE